MPLECSTGFDITIDVAELALRRGRQLQLFETADGFVLGTATPDGFEIRHLDFNLRITDTTAFDGSSRRWILVPHEGAFILVSGPNELDGSPNEIRVQPLDAIGVAVGEASLFRPEEESARLLAAAAMPGRLRLGLRWGPEFAQLAEYGLTTTSAGLVLSSIRLGETVSCESCREISLGQDDTWLGAGMEVRPLIHLEGSSITSWTPRTSVDGFHREAGSSRVWAFSARFGHGRHQTAVTLSAAAEDGIEERHGAEFDASSPLWIDTEDGPMIAASDYVRVLAWPPPARDESVSLFHCDESDDACASADPALAARRLSGLNGFIISFAGTESVRLVCVPDSDIVLAAEAAEGRTS